MSLDNLITSQEVQERLIPDNIIMGVKVIGSIWLAINVLSYPLAIHSFSYQTKDYPSTLLTQFQNDPIQKYLYYGAYIATKKKLDSD